MVRVESGAGREADFRESSGAIVGREESVQVPGRQDARIFLFKPDEIHSGRQAEVDGAAGDLGVRQTCQRCGDGRVRPVVVDVGLEPFMPGFESRWARHRPTLLLHWALPERRATAINLHARLILRASAGTN